MRTIGVLLAGPADFAGWRDHARRLLAAEVPPEAVEWRIPGEAPGLFATGAVPDAAAVPSIPADRSEQRTTDRTPGHPTAGAASDEADASTPAVPRPSGISSEQRTAGGTLGHRLAGAAPDAPAPATPHANGISSEQRIVEGMPGHQPTAWASDAAFGAVALAVSRPSGESSERRKAGEPPGHPSAVMSADAAPGAVALAPSRPSGLLSEQRTADQAPPPHPTGPAFAPAVPPPPEISSGKRTAGGTPGRQSTDSIPDTAVSTPCATPPEQRTVGGTAGHHAADAGANTSASAAPPRPEDLSERRTGGESAAESVSGTAPDATSGAAHPAPTVPRAFVDLSGVAIRHRDRERFALLYRVLWRLTHGEPSLMRVATDADIVRLEAMAKSVRRDAHKMHAFVRFREIRTEDGSRFVSWFEPDHHILEAETGFFIRRFAGMRWSILTPSASAHWDGAALTMGPGARRADAPAEDAHEDLWRAYYASIFNPARLKPDAMRAVMPVKYWRNLPEARIIPRLLAEAPRRAAAMVERGPSAPASRRQRNVHVPGKPAAASDVTAIMPADLFTASVDPEQALAALRDEMLALNSLPPWTAEATQMVFGEGPVGAPLVFVGEQPGDEEDIAGRPFVGPAGRMFNKAMEEAGVPRGEAYVTNAVKHFKFKPTGRRRLHQSPDAGDITYYRPFLKREIDLVGPQLVVTLGATALRALSGKPLAINKTRGEVIPMADGPPIFPTVHPSYLLRLPDPDSKAREYERFVADLRRAHREVA